MTAVTSAKQALSFSVARSSPGNLPLRLEYMLWSQDEQGPALGGAT